MTDKQFIKVLKKIKERCLKISCGECPFGKRNYCQLLVIACKLNAMPIGWNIEEIESVIEDE